MSSIYRPRTRAEKLRKSVCDARYRARNYESIMRKQRARQLAARVSRGTYLPSNAYEAFP